MVRCDRPAKKFVVDRPEVAHWIASIRLDPAIVDCCVGHYRKLTNEGILLTRIDRRKKVQA